MGGRQVAGPGGGSDHTTFDLIHPEIQFVQEGRSFLLFASSRERGEREELLFDTI